MNCRSRKRKAWKPSRGWRDDCGLSCCGGSRRKWRPICRPGSNKWERISWDEAIKGIARHVKDTRDRTFVAKNAKGETVNRAPGIAWIGGCTDTNEFNFLQWKAISAFGVPYRDTQARV